MVHRTDRTGEALTGAAETEVVIDPRRISWGAVIAGTVLAIVIGFLLNLLGVGIGLATIDPATGGLPSASDIGTGALIWWLIAGIIALFVGGYATARLAGVWRNDDAILHGLITWSVTSIVTLWLLTTALGGILGGAYGTLTSALGMAGTGVSAAAEAAGSVDAPSAGQIGQWADRLLAEVAPNANEGEVRQARERLISLVPNILQGGEPAAQAADEATQIISNLAGVTPEEAGRRLEAAVTDLGQQAEEAVEAAAGAISTAAFWSFVALLLGAIATALGGWVGTRSRGDMIVAAVPHGPAV